MSSNAPVEFAVLEEQKENVLPVKEGYSARALATTFQHGGPLEARSQLASQRDEFEKRLLESDDLDDPLEVYLDYIKWTNNSYPSGATTESGLVQLLERCTCKFRDEEIYKDDPRFLRVWLQYIRFSDTPKDVFMYLSKKEIGKNLAAYYEEYASYLEVSGRRLQAKEVFEAGINIGARPLERLKRRYSEFLERLASNPPDITETNGPNSPILPTVRPALMALDSGSGGLSTEEAASASSSAGTTSSRPKLQVFSDPNGIQSGSSLPASSWGSLGSMAQRKKENVIVAEPWQGQKLEMSADYMPKRQRPPVIYREAPSVPGKRPERIGVALQYLVNENGEEICLYEMLASSRGLLFKQFPRSDAHQAPIAENSPSSPVRRPASPTMTAFTKAATDDVLEMFNKPLDESSSDSIDLDDEDDEDDDDDDEDDDENMTNEGTHRDGGGDNEVNSRVSMNSSCPDPSISNLVQETDKLLINKQIKQTTQPTVILVNPMTEGTRKEFTKHLRSFLQDRNYLEFTSRFNKIKTLKNALPFSPQGNKTVSVGKMHVLKFPQDETEMYCLRKALGVGGYGYVYLAESSNGDLKAVKVEPTNMAWEYYMLKVAEKRMHNDRDYDSVVHASKAITFADETYTIMDYLPQGTSLDMRVIGNNIFDEVGIPEVVVVFFAIQLLRCIDTLHRNHIIHGDLKPDNVMMRIDPSKLTSKAYNRSGKDGWANQGITFIDFGRAIDLELFGDEVQFISDWKTDNEDCIAMREGKPWTFEADYYGIAGILYTLLFGQKIQVLEDKDKLGNRHFRPSQSFKRYWQRDMWTKLFDVLLNPLLYCGNDRRKMPLSVTLAERRNELEDWLEANSESGKSSLWSCLHELKTTLHSK